MNDYSRVNLFTSKLLTASKTEGEVEKSLKGMEVLISLDPSLEGASNTARFLCGTLGRLPGKVLLDKNNLSAEHSKVLSSAYQAVKGRPLEASNGAAPPSIKIHIGTDYRKDAFRAVPEGYGGHIVASQEKISVKRPANGLGSFYTAALAAAEAFKIATNLHARGRAPLFEHFTFCPVTLSEDLSRVPDLPEKVEINLAILGLGAIGSAVAVVLSEMDMQGNVLLVDNQRFSKENLATYSLGTTKDLITEPWKVELAEKVLKKFSVAKKTDPVEALPRLIDNGSLGWPEIIITSLDNVEARFAAQRLWPDRLIDPATGDTMIGLRAVSLRQPCLMCFLSGYDSTKSSIKELERVTGLSVEILRRGDNLLEDSNINGLPTAQKLRPFVGKPICGLAEAFGLTGSAESFQPSIPFASQQAACLAVGRMIGQKLGLRYNENHIQFDVFKGPGNATRLQEKGDSKCYCAERFATIEQVREDRSKRRIA